jgi:hypothetical protein
MGANRPPSEGVECQCRLGSSIIKTASPRAGSNARLAATVTRGAGRLERAFRVPPTIYVNFESCFIRDIDLSRELCGVSADRWGPALLAVQWVHALRALSWAHMQVRSGQVYYSAAEV